MEQEHAPMELESGQCFICRGPAKLSPLPGQKEWTAFDVLCDLLDLPWAARLDVTKPRNSEFCRSCEIHIQDAVEIQNEIKSLNSELAKHKFYLHSAITRSYQCTSDADADGEAGRSSSLTLGRMLSQCWSRCEVVLDLLSVNKKDSGKVCIMTTEDLAVQDATKASLDELDQDSEEKMTMGVDSESEWCPSEDSKVEAEARSESESNHLVESRHEIEADGPNSEPPAPSAKLTPMYPKALKSKKSSYSRKWQEGTCLGFPFRTKNGQYICGKCSASYGRANGKSNFKNHIYKHKGLLKWKTTVRETRNGKYLYLKKFPFFTAEQDRFRCGICQKSMTGSKRAILVHMASHYAGLKDSIL